MRGLPENQTLGNAPIVKVSTGTDQGKLKFCPKCKKIKRRTEFHKSKQLKDGLYSYCKKCNNEKRAKWYDKNCNIVKRKAKIYRIENNEEVTKKQREYYQSNRENCLLIAKKSRDKNKEKLNQRMRERRLSDQEWKESCNSKSRERHEKNKEQANQKRRAYYQKNKDRFRERAKERNDSLSRDQKDHINAKAREWWSRNKDVQNEKMRRRRDSNITKKISNNISTALRHSIHGNKAGRRWECLVGYTVKDVKIHLESLFTKGMNWECFLRGEIHIDHKIPLILFTFNSPDDDGFKKAWSLKNLQPLWAADNLKKNDKILYPELLFELLYG